MHFHAAILSLGECMCQKDSATHPCLVVKRYRVIHHTDDSSLSTFSVVAEHYIINSFFNSYLSYRLSIIEPHIIYSLVMIEILNISELPVEFK